MVRIKRGCGYRVLGGLYFCANGEMLQCNLDMPIPIPDVCPCCLEGIKRSRGLSFISSKLLNLKEGSCDGEFCATRCPFGKTRPEQYGLMWIGESFYPTPDDFLTEAQKYGISKRIPFVSSKLILNKTWVLLAHPKAIRDDNGKLQPGIVFAFQPSRIEMPVDGRFMTPETRQAIQARGIQPVECEPDADGIHAVEY